MDYASILSNFTPLIIILVFWFFFGRKITRDQQDSVGTMMDINRKMIEQNERMIEQLEQIKLLLKDRKN